MGDRIIEQNRLTLLLLILTGAPMDEVLRPVGSRTRLAVAVHVGQHRGCDPVAQIGHQVAERLELVIRLPFRELGRADLELCLPDALA